MLDPNQNDRKQYGGYTPNRGLQNSMQAGGGREYNTQSVEQLQQIRNHHSMSPQPGNRMDMALTPNQNELVHPNANGGHQIPMRI